MQRQKPVGVGQVGEGYNFAFECADDTKTADEIHCCSSLPISIQQ